MQNTKYYTIIVIAGQCMSLVYVITARVYLVVMIFYEKPELSGIIAVKLKVSDITNISHIINCQL